MTTGALVCQVWATEEEGAWCHHSCANENDCTVNFINREDCIACYKAKRAFKQDYQTCPHCQAYRVQQAEKKP